MVKKEDWNSPKETSESIRDATMTHSDPVWYVQQKPCMHVHALFLVLYCIHLKVYIVFVVLYVLIFLFLYVIHVGGDMLAGNYAGLFEVLRRTKHWSVSPLMVQS